ncbi:MAG: PadR family transcriptional regulator [Candidatus Thorarchaeota archaeon]
MVETMAPPDDSSNDLLPTTFLTVLSIIGEGTKYGYEINKIIRQLGYREWAELRLSSVYKALSRLEDCGLIKGKKRDNRVKASRKTYSLTRKGRNLLKKQIRVCLSNPPREESLFDLGVTSMSLLTQEEVLDALREHKRSLESSLEIMEVRRRSIDDIERLRRVTPEEQHTGFPLGDADGLNNMAPIKALYDRSAAIVRCKMTWLDQFIETVQNGDGFTFASRGRWW